jgi:hypothetical protein
MAKYAFTSIQRMAIWKAYKSKCAYCGELLRFNDLEIDHFLPESLLGNSDELERTKLEYGLDSEFEINSYYNWIPSCRKCNRTKSDRVYSKPATFYFLEMVAKPKYEEIIKIEQNLEKTMKKEGFLTRTEATQVIEEYIKDLVVNNLIISPATKRRDTWIDEYLSKAYQLIIEKVAFSVVENLPNNELFITAVLQATSIAVRNHQKEKLEALKNAIVNSVLPNAPDESLQLTFLNFIDIFTPCHLIMIDFINDPKDWCIKNNVKVDEFMNHYSYKSEKPYELDLFLGKIFTQIKTRKYLYEQAIEDISTKGLIACPKSTQRPFLVKLTSLDLHKNRIYLSDTGKQFLNYIKFSK